MTDVVSASLPRLRRGAPVGTLGPGLWGSGSQAPAHRPCTVWPQGHLLLLSGPQLPLRRVRGYTESGVTSSVVRKVAEMTTWEELYGDLCFNNIDI